MSTADPSKPDLRAAALARRDALAPAARAAAAEAVAARAAPVVLGPHQIVAGYAPIRSEFDPMPLMGVLASRGARLALPVIVGRDAPLEFRDWHIGQPLQSGPLGISEPGLEARPVEPDVVLVPLAAFDRAGHRIGYGAGYYDRTLVRLRRRKPVIAIGLAFSTQEIARVPALPHDVRLDYIATEYETIAL